MKKAIILIVEKDSGLSAVVVDALWASGYEVVEASDAVDGLKKIYQMHPDVIIASTDLPPVNGEDACLCLRQASYLPMIAIGTREEVVDMLEIGADACIIRPPSGREVVARVDMVLRRRGDRPGGGGPDTGTLLGGENDYEGLSPTEFRLSSCLRLNRGQLLGYPRIITEVWGGKRVTPDTLHCYIRRLRRKLSNFNIFGVRGVGYVLTGDG